MSDTTVQRCGTCKSFRPFRCHDGRILHNRRVECRVKTTVEAGIWQNVRMVSENDGSQCKEWVAR
jgi:hypothetical protein